MPRQFDLICFDWDGTLFDSTAAIARAIQQTVVDAGGERPSDADAAHVIGLALMPALAHVAPGVPASQYPQLAENYRRHYLASEGGIALFDGVRGLLEMLRARHHWLAVATGKSRAGLDRALRASGLTRLFDATRTADETAGKPSPVMLNELMRQFGVDAGRTLMVGDTTHDLQMAANAGCPCVAVSYGAHAPQAFAAFSPLFVAHSVADLHRWLGDNG